MRPARFSTALASAAALLLTACGRTVAHTGALTSSGTAASSSGLGAAGGSAGQAPGAAGSGAPSATGSGTVGGAAAPSGPQAANGSGSAAGGSGATGGTATDGMGVRQDSAGVLQGPGVSASTVTIGVSYVSNGDAANAAIGASGISQGDQVGESKAVIADINSHGGVAHRKLLALFHPYDAQSTNTNAAQDESACADYTQDHKVFAVADKGLTETLPACLAKAGVLQDFSGDLISNDAAFFRRFPHFQDVGTVSQDRMMADLARELVHQSYFSGWNATTSSPAAGTPAKLGVLSLDRPDWNRPLDHVLLPALAKAGHPVASGDVYRVHPTTTTSDAGATAADVQSAALRFRNDGVTHVILLDGSGVLTLFFTRNASGQHYYPRYGVNSGTGMQALVTAGDIDPAQLKGAVGIGWLPGLDLSAAAAKKYETPAAAHCLAVMSKAGFTFSDANSKGIAYGICDELYFLANAINSAGSSVTLANAQAAIDRLGSSFIPAVLPAAYFSATQHDAVTTAYDLVWSDRCGCAAYTDNGHKVP
jgi:hypothetical protein